MTTDNTPNWAFLAQTIASIDVSLKTIADYVQLLHIEKTGEKTWEVQRFVVGTDGEDQPCVWLYATHPGIEFAVTRIYHERLEDLPLTVPANAKVWDGEVAPSAEAAAKKGYFYVAPAPFTISLMPTGKKTDAGLDIRKFSRIVSVGEPSRNPASNGQPPQSASKAPAPPADARQAAKDEEDAARAAYLAGQQGEKDFAGLKSASLEPAQAAALKAAAASRPATVQRPVWSGPDAAKAWALEQKDVEGAPVFANEAAVEAAYETVKAAYTAKTAHPTPGEFFNAWFTEVEERKEGIPF